MKTAIPFVVRQSGWLAFLFLLFAVLNAAYVGAGLWQGVGLHGYIIESGTRGGPPRIVSVWSALVCLLMFLFLAVLFGWIAAWQSGMIGFGLGKVGTVENPGKGNGLRTKRRQRKRH